MTRSEHAEGPSYIRAAHYFADNHPTNFWEAFDASRVDEDLALIRSLGFNTVIFVVPWRGFQKTLAPHVYNSFYFDRLRFCISAAVRAGLKYVLRVSYPHCPDPASVGFPTERIEWLLRYPEVRVAWADYLRQIQDVVEGDPDYLFSFYSWEDLWIPIGLFDGLSVSARTEVAVTSGFQRYLSERHGLNEVSVWYGVVFESWEDVPIPLSGTIPYFYFVRFIDHFWGHELLSIGRKAIPRLNYEIRIDWDRLEINGKSYHFPHDLLFDDPGPRACYFAPYIGARNEGEDVDALTLVGRLQFALNLMTENGRWPNLFVEQFNYIDNHPDTIATNAKISGEEVDKFIVGAAPLLLKHSVGYGVWTTIDYLDNVVFNPRFQLGLEGWESAGDSLPTVERDRHFVSVHLGSSQSIAQTIRMVHYWRKAGLVVRIVGRSLDNVPAEISVRVGDIDVGKMYFFADKETQTINLHQKDVLALHEKFGTNVPITLTVFSGKIAVYEVFLYSHVQTKGILNSDRTRGQHCDAIEQLNACLSAGNPSGDSDIGATYKSNFYEYRQWKLILVDGHIAHTFIA
ncbi:hypothetical protein [Thiorhodospira sibirica]|uniref:hypothetical protein n=1 Tax=Thiorhodospira sibirica TaxID=154347 RepID=UPI00022C0B5A|nr:hypothetical protein [Thiorhodospira sibirica]